MKSSDANKSYNNNENEYRCTNQIPRCDDDSIAINVNNEIDIN